MDRDGNANIGDEGMLDLREDSATEVESDLDSSDDGSESESESEPFTQMFGNKLAGMILRREWQSALDHLKTEAGQHDSRSGVFAIDDVGEWVPLHVLFLKHDYLPKALRPPRPALPDIHGQDQLGINVTHEHEQVNSSDANDRNNNNNGPPLELVNALLDANSSALLEECPGGRQVVYCAMEQSADPEIIRAMLDREPLTLAKPGVFGNPLIHGMLHNLDDLNPHLLVAYLRILFGIKLLERCKHGHTILHYGLIRSPRGPEIMDFLLESCPQLASMPLHKNWPDTLPIHRACLRDQRRVVEQLVAVHPEGLFLKDANLSLPIHLFCNSRRTSNSEVGYSNTMETMVRAHPTSVIELGRDGNIPIHADMKKLFRLSHHQEDSQHYSSFSDRVKAHQFLVSHTYQQILQQTNNCNVSVGRDTKTNATRTNMTGLHKAAWIAHLMFPDSEAQTLFKFSEELFPRTSPQKNNGNDSDNANADSSDSLKERVFQKDSQGNTFLHLLWNESGKSAVLQKHWKRVKRNDAQWRQHLMQPVGGQPSSAAWRSEVNARICLYDENITTSNTNDTLLGAALHALENSGVSAEHRLRLVNTANMQDGELPLHRVLRYGRSNAYTEKEAEQLIDLYPEALRMANIHGSLPLHLALKHQCPTKVHRYVVMLLRLYPSPSTVADPEEKLLPFMLAALKRDIHGKKGQSHSCLDSTFTLLRNVPSIL